MRFANGTELSLGESQGANREAVFEEQIRYTVAEHFRRQARLKGSGVKVLSLFFMDRVDSYVRRDGVIRTLLARVFNEERTRYPDWKDADLDR